MTDCFPLQAAELLTGLTPGRRHILVFVQHDIRLVVRYDLRKNMAPAKAID
jgi:hypothetical protein